MQFSIITLPLFSLLSLLELLLLLLLFSLSSEFLKVRAPPLPPLFYLKCEFSIVTILLSMITTAPSYPLPEKFSKDELIIFIYFEPIPFKTLIALQTLDDDNSGCEKCELKICIYSA